MRLEYYRSNLAYKTLQLDGHTIEYLEREGYGDTIVLLHGFSADKDCWVRFVRHMPENYRILIIDMPGHGGGNRYMDQDYDLRHITGGVTRTIEALGLERIHLVGNSLGGLVSIHYALDNPDKVITLGLFNSAGVSQLTPSESYLLLENGDNPFIVTSEDDFYRLMDLCFYEKPYIPWPGLSVIAHNYIERSEFNRKIWNDIHESLPENDRVRHVSFKDLSNRLPELKMPTFVLWGDKDRILHVSSVEVYKRYLPDAQVVIMENCGHAPMLERSEEAAGHYAQFMRQTSSTKEDHSASALAMLGPGS
jgi:pimeloyl-ACP methyl ester carboxylesterase